MLSKVLLVFGFLLMSWQWALTMPSRSSGHATAPPAAAQNFSDFMVQSIFDLPPNCKPGEVATGPHQRCRHQA
ncbi:uncharacterized protein LOC117583886 [Drosophila guanche]|uniref:Uncharacterized protein n=1 Tax=Drosophila guanche TaxID=7266 RepID=A0A3B0JHT0_DROGU|nr:uncharacterized protein LOC117583886 [Drosophila guanche]SPP74940.1 Hypothetical predicted protein [Drosophila guanche]